MLKKMLNKTLKKITFCLSSLKVKRSPVVLNIYASRFSYCSAAYCKRLPYFNTKNNQLRISLVNDKLWNKPMVSGNKEFDDVLDT